MLGVIYKTFSYIVLWGTDKMKLMQELCSMSVVAPLKFLRNMIYMMLLD